LFFYSFFPKPTIIMAAKAPPTDKKTELTFKTIENLRASGPMFQDFIKAASNYQKQLLKLSEAGRQLADAIQKVGQLQSGDVGEGIVRLAETHRSLELKRDQVSRTFQDDLINALQKSSKPEDAELNNFEADYKKARSSTRTQIDKLEQNSKKAGKKGPEALKQAIATLNDKIKEAEQIKSDKLRTVLLIERKKYCNFLAQWGPVLSSEGDHFQEGMKLKEQEQFFRTLAASNQHLPPAMEELVTANQERTFVQIQADSQGSGFSADYSYANSFNTSYDDNSSSGMYGGGGNSASIGTATALYDFAGEQATDLPFYAGDVITILQDDDGSGWLTGELNGRTGIFPSSYVQWN